MNFNNIWYILCLFSVSDARINQATAQANKMLHANLMNHEMIYCNYTPDSKVKLVLTKVGKYLILQTMQMYQSPYTQKTI